MSTTTTPTTDRLRARLAYLREEEHQHYQRLLVVEPYSPAHVACHGRWTATRARIGEVERQLREEQEN